MAFIPIILSCHGNWDDGLYLPELWGKVGIDVMRDGGAPRAATEVPMVGDTLRANINGLPGAEDGFRDGGYSFQWRLETGGRSEAVSRQGPEYPSTEIEFGHSVTVIVFKEGFNGGVISRPSHLITLPAPAPDVNDGGSVRITGQAKVGSGLETNFFGHDSQGQALDNDAGFFQWARSRAEDGDFVPIMGATLRHYTIGKADRDHYLRVMAVYPGHSGFLQSVFGPVGTMLKLGQAEGILREVIGGTLEIPLAIEGFYGHSGNLSLGTEGDRADLHVLGLPEGVFLGGESFLRYETGEGRGSGMLVLKAGAQIKAGTYPIFLTLGSGNITADFILEVQEATVLSAGEPVGSLQVGVGGNIKIPIGILGFHDPEGNLGFGPEGSGAVLEVSGLPPGVTIAGDSLVHYDLSNERGSGMLTLEAGPGLAAGEYAVRVKSRMGLVFDDFRLKVHEKATMRARLVSDFLQERVGGQAAVEVTISGFHLAGPLGFGQAEPGPVDPGSADLLVYGLPPGVRIDQASSFSHDGWELGSGTLKLKAGAEVLAGDYPVEILSGSGLCRAGFVLKVYGPASLTAESPVGLIRTGRGGTAEIAVRILNFAEMDGNLGFGGPGSPITVTGLPPDLTVGGSVLYDGAADAGSGTLTLSSAGPVQAGLYPLRIALGNGTAEDRVDLHVRELSMGLTDIPAQAGIGGSFSVPVRARHLDSASGILEIGRNDGIEVTGLVPGLDLTGSLIYDAATASGSGELTLNAAPETPAGIYRIRITAGGTHDELDLYLQELTVNPKKLVVFQSEPIPAGTTITVSGRFLHPTTAGTIGLPASGSTPESFFSGIGITKKPFVQQADRSGSGTVTLSGSPVFAITHVRQVQVRIGGIGVPLDLEMMRNAKTPEL
ncbi:MAG: hypothetical protein FWD94_08190, partial [Treponema sp.]|nr:hypothetical protein [Treponema sp.]